MLKELNKMMHSKYAKLSHLPNVNKNEEWVQVFLLTSHKTMLHPVKARTLPSQLGMDRDCIQVGMQLDFILNTSFSVRYAGTATLQLVLLIRKLIWAKEKERDPTMVSYKRNEITFRYDMVTHTHRQHNALHILRNSHSLVRVKRKGSWESYCTNSWPQKSMCNIERGRLLDTCKIEDDMKHAQKKHFMNVPCQAVQCAGQMHDFLFTQMFVLSLWLHTTQQLIQSFQINNEVRFFSPYYFYKKWKIKHECLLISRLLVHL